MSADGLYLNVSPGYQRGLLKGISRALKAAQHDCGVLIGGGQMNEIIVACNLNNPKWHRLMNVVLSPEGICTTINTVGGG